MAVMAREHWTDERLDYFERAVGERFDGTKVEVGRLETRMNERFDRVDERFDAFERRVDERFSRVDAEFGRIDKRLEQMDKRFEQVDKRFEQVDKRFEGIEIDIREMKRALERQNAIMVSGFIGLAGLIASNAVFF